MQLLHVLVIIPLSSIVPRINSFINGLSCDLGTPCTTSTESLNCQLLDLDENLMAILSFYSNRLGPSEPTNLHVEKIDNGDRGLIRVKWKGPDDSSSRDLIGFRIEVAERGDSFKQYIMDLRGNSVNFLQQKSMEYVYELCCFYDNPFSQKMSVDIIVTSLPINGNSTEKFVQLSNEPIYSPTYMYSSSMTNTVQLKQDHGDGINNTVIIVPSTIVVVITVIAIIIYIKFKVLNRRVNRSLSNQTSNATSASSNENESSAKPTNGGTEHYIPFFRIETINTQLDNHHMCPHQSPCLVNTKYDMSYSDSGCRIQTETGSDGTSKTERTKYHVSEDGFNYKGNDSKQQGVVFSSQMDKRNDSGTGSELLSECSEKQKDVKSDLVSSDSKDSLDGIKCVRFQEPEPLSDSDSLSSDSLTQEMLRINNMTSDYTC